MVQILLLLQNIQRTFGNESEFFKASEVHIEQFQTEIESMLLAEVSFKGL